MIDPSTTSDVVDAVAEDCARRCREGEQPTVEEYVVRHPQWADEIREVLPAVLLLEEHKRSRADTWPELAAGPEEPLPSMIGGYRIIREIGRGGMGVVYEAEEESLGRRVAMKVLPKSLGSAALRARFRHEYRAAARLRHANIVPVISVGKTDEPCFYVMQLIDGQGLDRLIATAARLPLASIPERRVARIGLDAAEALACAHSHKILHRDIKPSNLLLDTAGNLWVTDFGVAKLIEEESLTGTGEPVGSLRYMAPEQFSGDADARSDIYSLGVTLYELLTLRAAFPVRTPHQVAHEEPLPRPRQLNPDIPKDLETIVLKAMARDPGERYQTAQELAGDLRRFLDHRPILARRAALAEQAWRWCRRNAALTLTAAAAVLLMLVITALSAKVFNQEAAANHATTKTLAAATEERAETEQMAALTLESLNRIYDRLVRDELSAPPLTSSAGSEPAPSAPLPAETSALLEDLRVSYQSIAHAAAKYPHLQTQAADAHRRSGEICKRLGRNQEAAASYRIAIDLYTRLSLGAAADPIRANLARLPDEKGWSVSP